MRVGALVVKRLRWSINSHLLGVVVGQSATNQNLFLVLWNKNGRYKLQEHLDNALIDLEEQEDKVLKNRQCISV